MSRFKVGQKVRCINACEDPEDTDSDLLDPSDGLSLNEICIVSNADDSEDDCIELEGKGYWMACRFEPIVLTNEERIAERKSKCTT